MTCAQEPTRCSLYCCSCAQDVPARLTDGHEVYPHRPDLGTLPFWRCDTCGNYVGCHHKTLVQTTPLGCIPTPELRAARSRLHGLMDPLWHAKRISRQALYARLSEALGRKFHAGDLRSLEEAERMIQVVEELRRQ